MTQRKNSGPSPPSSAPCSMHEIVSASDGTIHFGDPQQALEVARWRKAERERLVKDRMDMSHQDRRIFDARIQSSLTESLPEMAGKTFSLYWPIRGEPDIRPLAGDIIKKGGRCLLPVVTAKSRPLTFRQWSPGDPLQKGIWNIPVPSDNAAVAVPDFVIAPVVGFDKEGFRLGYGGGFYDRTLASLPNLQGVYGVGYQRAILATIYPQWHDVPMSTILTEQGLQTPPPSSF